MKEVILLMVEEMNQRLESSGIPYNLVKWSLNRSSKPRDYDRIGNFVLEINKEDIDDEVSGNVERTIKTFWKLGIDLTQNSEFQTSKDKIRSIIAKRNDIVHHSDEASDVTFGDVIY